MSKALLVIDVQNDYFPDGKFPLWNTNAVLANIERIIGRAKADGISVIFVQHIVKGEQAPFFCEDTSGVKIHPRLLDVSPESVVVEKCHADSFLDTALEKTLKRKDITELLVCGMMTHNCVTHTAMSQSAAKYNITVLPDCCTTVSETIHLLALDALSHRVKITPSIDALPGHDL
ncbi:MAG: cysteine hydrolase family protein [Planctomycetaceae bacterium]